MISSAARRLSLLSMHINKHFSTSQTTTKTINNIEIISNGSLAKLILNKPKALNSLSTQMVTDVLSQLEFLNNHKAVWMEGAGGKAFCAGGDVKALFVEGATREDRVNFFRKEFTMDYKLNHLKALQIANWDGIVMGGGVGISAFSPFIIATENSMYAMPEGKIGFFTDVGAGYFLSRLRNNIGYYLGMTGARLKVQDVYVAGLANFYIPRQNIQKAYEQLRDGLGNAGNPKQYINSVLSKYHQAPNKKKIDNQDQIKDIFGRQSVKQIYESVKNNQNSFHQNVLKMLQQQCPLSTHITHRSIKISKNRDLKQCFQQDFILAQNYSSNQNFSEGVRCLLIDKGQTPKWTHKHLLDVSQEDVEKMFKKPQNQVFLQI